MPIDWTRCLQKDSIGWDVGCDGPSLPILTIWVRAGTRTTFVCLGKEEAEEFIRKLQSAVREM